MRNQRTLRLRTTFLALAALVAACGGRPDAAESLGQEQQASLDPSAPYRSDFTFGFIDTGDRGQIADAPATSTTSSDVHAGVFSNGRDANAPTSTDPASWEPIAAGGDFREFESSPSFTPLLDSEIARAVAHRETFSSDTLTTIKSVLQTFLPVKVTDLPQSDSFVGWAPEQARWMSSQYVVTDAANDIETRYDYADPAAFGAVAERGARLYCAAREAQRQQAANPATQAMGRQVALPLTILGAHVDLGVVEATFALDGPERQLGAAGDGAQAFHVPMRVGTRFTPIGGLSVLPGFPEIVHPIDVVTGDTEVVSGTPKQTFITGTSWICSGKPKKCRQFLTTANDYPEQYKTLTHADAITSRGGGMHVEYPTIPLFTLGVLSANLDLSGDLDVGTPIPATSAPMDDHLIASAPPGWPAFARTDGASSSPWAAWGFAYDDGAWTTASPDAPLAGLTMWNAGATGTTFGLGATSPMLVRALADDDHHVRTESRIGLDGTVTATAGLSLGIAQLTLTAKGTAGIHLAHQTDVRDGELLLTQTAGTGLYRNPPIPETALTVTPSSEAGVSLTLNVDLEIVVPLPFKTIDEHVAIYSGTTGKTWPSGPWVDTSRVRLVTGSDLGDPTNQPWAESHLANMSGTFSSFAESVPACLADTSSNPPPQDPCGAKPPSGTPHGELCVYSGSFDPNLFVGTGASSPWFGACADPSATAAAIDPAATPAQTTCYADLVSYLCAPTSQEQTFDGRRVVAHVLSGAGPSVALGALIAECAAAWPSVDPSLTFKRLFQFAACDGGATLIDPKDVVTSGATPDTTPPGVGASDCH